MNIRAYLIALAVLSMLAGAGVCAGQTLRQAAEQIGLLVGTSTGPSLFSRRDYAATMARQFNMIEPEAVMKWRITEPAEGIYNFKPGDELVAFAKAHGMKVRGHNLLWSSSNPAWLTNHRFSPSELRRIMKRHIQTEVRHYRGKVFAWDVLDEAFASSGQLRPSIWYDKPGIGLAGKGTAYIEQAFRWAHEADPRALLFYNDYGCEGINAKSNAIYAMVKDFKRRGVPIDGVGLQMHVYSETDARADVAANIARLAKLGVEVHITEMDVELVVDAHGQVSESQLEWQAKIYRRVAAACAEDPACTAFQTWGFTDRYSWIPAHTKGAKGAALLFDADYRPKPSFRAVLGAFEQAFRKNPELKKQRLQFEQRVEDAARGTR